MYWQSILEAKCQDLWEVEGALDWWQQSILCNSDSFLPYLVIDNPVGQCKHGKSAYGAT